MIATLALLQVFVIAAGVYLVVNGSERIPIQAAAPKPAPTPIVTAPPVLIAALDGPLPAKSTLTTLLRDAMGDPGIGGKVAGAVIDTETGQTLFDGGSTTALTPASTTKVVTGTAALASIGADVTFATTVMQNAPGKIVLVGGGDPTLAGPKADPRDHYPRAASLQTLAARTAKALKTAGVTSVTLSYDASLFQGPTTAPGWKPTYVPEGSASPVTALAIDEGRVVPRQDFPRSANPPADAAQAFGGLLAKYGIKVGKTIKPAKAARSDQQPAQELARVESAPVYALVERMLTESDNDLAEALARHVAIAEKQPHTYAGQAKAYLAVLARLGITEGIEVHDGSGLSTANKITPAALAKLVALGASPQHPELHSMVSGMPVAGFTGTLGKRYTEADSRAGAGLVRAKTGTLDGVNTLTGLVHSADGRLLSFAFMANGVTDPGKTVKALDRLATLVSRAA
ncbi:D-alanyl-D-alanine carboxypeptidase/D-alanyl-D-alanine endopeptidase [Herbidospora mongoliensis]|uniref:D-alanyl-D-alanine carboxypeptidase/D-alanyl-D-alanine endopeptidase n=1 Tax=Herbidospora mongoliensis TaxID=688067 RepID=UPI0009FC9056|nr:D-alanyl-D-alanine carboxypeptidase/D-alanyl-D-alanine-endopeptidase [Herbidospora mongoliensis]